MGAALEVVTGLLTTSSLTAGTYSTFTANTGQSFTVRATPTDQAGSMLSPWGQSNGKGYLQIKSPRMHDTTIGTTFATQPASSSFSSDPLAGLDYDEPTWNTDVLTVQYTPVTTISASETECIALPMYYPNIGGIQANFMTWAQVQSYVNPSNKTGLHYVTWCRPSTAGTAGQIGTGVAINATNDQFKANHSYALLGFLVNASIATVLVQGTDTGNLYVGGPGTIDSRITRNWFVDLSLAQNVASIPIIQANNKANTFVYAVDGQTTSTALTVGLIWLDLGVIAGIGAA